MKITKEKVGLILVGAMFITNPLTGQYVLTLLDEAFREMFIYASWVTLVAAVYMIGLLGFYMWKSREVVKTTPKAKKSPKVAYIET